MVYERRHKNHVAPHAGAGIEIMVSREEGGTPSVAPHAGAGIEMVVSRAYRKEGDVAPHPGAGIEITSVCFREHCCKSRPTRARGLKLR